MRSKELPFSNFSASRLWLTSVVALAFILASTLGPGRNVAFAAMPDAAIGSHMAMASDDMHKSMPCCDDHGNMPAKTCADTALCTAMCGKMPVQLSSVIPLPLAGDVVMITMPPDTHSVGLSPSPLRRPPRMA